MKKRIVYLGVALLALANVSMASNPQTSEKHQTVFSTYDATPLNVAISKGDIEVVKKFIEYGADVNEESNGMTPLMTAARYNKVEIIKVLLANGARANAKDETGKTALKYAEASNAVEAVAVLKDVK